MNRRVVVTGIGVVSPLARDAEGLHAAACAGRHAGSRQEEFSVDGMASPLAAPYGDFDARLELGRENLRPLDRTGRLAATAARRALEASGWSQQDLAEHEVGLALGTLFGSLRTIAGFDRRSVSAGPSYAKPMDFANSVINAAAGQSGIRFNLRGPNATISGDLTAGLQALGFAFDLVRSGRCDALLAGGADELCVESLYGFHQLGLLCSPELERAVPLAECATGLMPAESAALMMLESQEAAQRRGAPILAEILGHGSAFDSGRGRDAREAGVRVTAAAASALSESGLAADAIDCVSVGANGTAGDAVEIEGLEHAVDGNTAVLSAKASTGEALGASGALQTVLAIESLRRQLAPGIPGYEDRRQTTLTVSAAPRELSGTTALVSSVGLQGKSAALVVRIAP